MKWRETDATWLRDRASVTRICDPEYPIVAELVTRPLAKPIVPPKHLSAQGEALASRDVLEIPKIIYKPYDELIIHELVRYKLDDLVNLNALGVQPGGLGKPLYWAAGLAMVTYSLPSTEAVVHDQLAGKAHWAHVAYAPKAKYESLITLRENNVKIPVINASTNPLFNLAASWIKQQVRLKSRTA